MHDQAAAWDQARKAHRAAAAGELPSELQGVCRSSDATVRRNGSSRISARGCTVRATYRRPDQSSRYSSILLILLQSLSMPQRYDPGF